MRWPWLSLALLGCQSNKPPAPDPWAGSAVAVPSAGAAKPDAPAARSCAIASPSPEATPLTTLVHVADLDGQRWHVGLEGRGEDARPVLVHLDARGNLLTTPLPEWTEHVAVIAPHTLRFLVTTKSPKWWTVDVSNPDAPSVSTPAAVADLPAGDYPKAFGADERRALIALYDKNPSDAGPPFYVGKTALYEVPSGKRLSPVLDLTAWRAECLNGRCFAVDSPNDTSSTLRLVEIDTTGEHVLAELVGTGAVWRDGDTWFASECAKSAGSVRALSLRTGEVRRGLLDVSAEACPRLEPTWFGRHFGLLERGPGSATALVVDASLHAESAGLGDLGAHSIDLAPMSDGLFVVSYEDRGGMMHSPSDREVRRYFEVWEFDGSAGFVARDEAGFTRGLRDVTRLPHDGEEGKFTRGYSAHALARGAYATAVVVGAESKSVRLRQACR